MGLNPINISKNDIDILLNIHSWIIGEDNLGKWIVTSAWPYAHDVPHLGNLIGSLLSADIFARFLRLKGEDVIYVTGSDEHGTPIEIKALQLGIKPEELSRKVHEKIVDILRGFNIHIDNYTRTHNPVHIKFTQEFYMKIFNNGYIFEQEDKVLYCQRDKIYLPDRFVIGTCPYCGYENARGDQCEKCGSLLTPIQLVNPKCVICGGKPVVKKSKHYYFNLPAFTEKLIKFISESTTLSENAKNFSLQMIKQGLKPRSITRNNRWGIPAPFPGAEDLTIYVWFEAVLGYVSAVIEYFKKKGKEDEWKKWWLDQNTNVAFFIGKDNIPFHTIIFPALLMATEDPYTLKFHVGATEFLMYEGQKFSKSKGIGIWCDEALELLPADYWRYALTLMRPEVRDTSFTWKTFEYAINEELNNHFGNLVYRLLTFVAKYFGGKLEKPNEFTEDERNLLNEVDIVKRKVEEHYINMRFQRVITDVMEIVRKANALMNMEEPWKKIKTDKEKAISNLYTIYIVIKAVSIMLNPIIPSSTSKILSYFGFDKFSWSDIDTREELVEIRGKLEVPFKKIRAQELVNKLNELRKKKTTKKISVSDMQRIEMRIGRIVKVEDIEGKENLYKIIVSMGDRNYITVAGIKGHYSKDELLGKKVVIITNIEEKIIAGIRSEAMILAAKDDGNIALLTPDRDLREGSVVY